MYYWNYTHLGVSFRCVTILLPWPGLLGHHQSLDLPSEITWTGTGLLCEFCSLYEVRLHVNSSFGPWVHVCREEAAGIIASQYSKKESGALAAYEEQLNEVARCVY